MSRFKNSENGRLAKYLWVYVNEIGTYAEDVYDGSVLTIETDADGYKYVADGDERVYIADAIIFGFKKKPKFEAGKRYVVNYIDGDPSNCKLENLEWKENNTSSVTKNGFVYFDGMRVGKDGSLAVCKDGKLVEYAQMRERWLDDDVDATWVFSNPKAITYETSIWGPELFDIDEWMAKAGYVKGDVNGCGDPEVLHIDRDVSNFNSGNLEWVDSSDPRFIEYSEKRYQRQKDLIKKYNTDLGYAIPDSWPQ